MIGMFVFSLVFGTFDLSTVLAASPGEVVINEIAWAGSVDSSSDEWIELYNTTGAPIDLTGWSIDDDNGSSVYALSGTIEAYGYYLIEDSEAAVNPNIADLVVNMSLANTGDSLVLYDDATQVIDTVNSSGGMWFAGSSSSYASMERIDATVSGDEVTNWADSDGSGSSATASSGSLILGTAGLLNSVSQAPVTGSFVDMNLSDSTPNVGDQIVLSVDIENVTDMFSYGFEINYDSAVLDLSSVAEGSFLSEDSAVVTSFQSGLENGVEGQLLVAEARTIDPKVGVSGNGNLFTVTFDVVGGDGQQSLIEFGAGSFIADPNGDLISNYSGVVLEPVVLTVAPASNLQLVEAASRYAIQLSWDPSADAEMYRVYREDAHGIYSLLAETPDTLFVDQDGVSNGGMIVPHFGYNYRVIAVKNGVESLSVDEVGMETRGLKGDNDRSDRVDGRDLDNLAKMFALSDSDAGFDPLVDTTYDGMIDGGDLIDIGLNFALTYSP